MWIGSHSFGTMGGPLWPGATGTGSVRPVALMRMRYLPSASPSDLANWNQFLDKVLKDGEQKGEEIESLMGNLGLYHRFSVTRGLEAEALATAPTAGDTIEYTKMYLAMFSVSRKLEICVDSLRLRDGVVSLGQLSKSKTSAKRRIL